MVRVLGVNRGEVAGHVQGPPRTSQQPRANSVFSPDESNLSVGAHDRIGAQAVKEESSPQSEASLKSAQDALPALGTLAAVSQPNK